MIETVLVDEGRAWTEACQFCANWLTANGWSYAAAGLVNYINAANGAVIPAAPPPPATAAASGPTVTDAGTGAMLLEGEIGAPPAMTRVEAQGQGFTGDQCSNCNSMRMKVAGHCMVCEDCGTTTGCS